MIALLAALTAIHAGERPCADLTAYYRDGNDEVGYTTVRVAKRWARVIREEPDQEKVVYRGRLPRGMCERMVRNALKGELWTSRSKRKTPLEDETRITIRMSVKGAGAFTARMWDFDVQNKAVFAIARAQLLQIARRVSKNVVNY